MATVALIETETVDISVWLDNDNRPRYAKVSALDTLPLSVVQRQYPVPEGSAWEPVSPSEAYVVQLGHGA